MSPSEPERQAESPVTGDPDFVEVARERSHGTADYDESAGNELQSSRPTPERTEQENGEEDTPVFPDED